MTADLAERAIRRILDANLDRAREGLRTIEEWCRFGLEQADTAALCKDLRQQLGQAHRAEYRAARDTANDPGTAITHPSEARREDIRALLLANFGRVQEALRVLEEYAKVEDPALATLAKQSRYRVYELETQLLVRDRLERLRSARLYLVTMPHDDLLTQVEKALQGGLQLVQYREKVADDLERLARARAVRDLCARYGALFIMNDRVDLALAVDADGVHLGQQDVPIALARRILGPDRIVGRSTTNPAEMAKALAEGADYIGVGPVFETPTKPGKAAAGFDYVAYARAQSPVPFYAIGGIDADNCAEVLAAGAERVAVVRAIMAAPDPTAVTRQLLQTLENTSHA